MRSSKCAASPCKTSLAMAVTVEASLASLFARAKATHPSAVITLVPFITARLSLGPRVNGARPPRASAAAASTISPPSSASRSPQSSAAR